MIKALFDGLAKQNLQNESESKLLAIAMTILTALAILAGSVAVPILCRPFYYAHIEPLQIRLRVSLQEEQIEETYCEIMDYCLGFTDTFALTHLKWSAEGAAHFADVRMLFILDLTVAVLSIILLAVLWAASRCCQIQPSNIKGHTPGYWAAAGLAVTFTTLGVLAALDFDTLFTAFHTVFFPGKDNWIFDSSKDPVINMLPQVFFQNCSILVLAFILGSCTVLLLVERKNRK